MHVNKLAAGGLVAIVTGLCVWAVSTIKDPLGGAKEQTWKAAPELQWKRSQVELEPRSDPLVLFASSLTEVAVGATPTIQAAVYVPAYSHIRAGSGRGRVELATTLSIQNSSRDTSIVLKSVTYDNMEGELVQSYLGRPAAHGPLAPWRSLCRKITCAAGRRHFIVHRASVSPVIEPVMIGVVGTTGHSFVRQGRNLRTVVN
jgi:Protein of unknown function (DUF3124)